MPEFFPASSDNDYGNAKILFNEYADWLGIDLSFQKFDKELEVLQTMYGSPDGGIILCKENETYAGCVAIRKLDHNTGEMKRLYVRNEFRKKGIASALLREAEMLAQRCGYAFIRLDTLNTMLPAMNLYQKNGYVITPPYYNNPVEGAVYFLKEL